MKVVINAKSGGFGLSPKALLELNKHGGTIDDISRSDPLLIAIVEKLGAAANGESANLKIVEIPDGVDYEIEQYDGAEHIAERHRTWS